MACSSWCLAFDSMWFSILFAMEVVFVSTLEILPKHQPNLTRDDP